MGVSGRHLPPGGTGSGTFHGEEASLQAHVVSRVGAHEAHAHLISGLVLLERLPQHLPKGVSHLGQVKDDGRLEGELRA